MSLLYIVQATTVLALGLFVFVFTVTIFSRFTKLSHACSITETMKASFFSFVLNLVAASLCLKYLSLDGLSSMLRLNVITVANSGLLKRCRESVDALWRHVVIGPTRTGWTLGQRFRQQGTVRPCSIAPVHHVICGETWELDVVNVIKYVYWSTLRDVPTSI